MAKIRVVLADDHGVVRDGLKMLINAQADLEVVGEAGNGEQAFELILRLQPDVAIVDISMPVMNGLELIGRLQDVDARTRVLALTANEDRAYLQQLLKMGTAGYLLKRSAADELNQAIRSVFAGRRYIDPYIISDLVQDMAVVSQEFPVAAPVALSDREEAVMRLVAQGFSNKEIAAKLDISVKTVETYKSRSTLKLGLRGRSDIVRYAISRGWLRDT